jgi:hypothetical protein
MEQGHERVRALVVWVEHRGQHLHGRRDLLGREGVVPFTGPVATRMNAGELDPPT